MLIMGLNKTTTKARRSYHGRIAPREPEFIPAAVRELSYNVRLIFLLPLVLPIIVLLQFTGTN